MMVTKYLLIVQAILVSIVCSEIDKRILYKNYSFYMKEYEHPIAYTTLGNTIELNTKVILNPAVADRGGAFALDPAIKDKNFEIELEYTVLSDLDLARGFMVLLTQHELTEEELDEEHIGIKQDFDGIVVFVFRHPNKNNKWFMMTLQNEGTRSAFRQEDQIQSGIRNNNHCEIEMNQGVLTSMRITVTNHQIITHIREGSEAIHRKCNEQMKVNYAWEKHYFAIAAKNSADDSGTQMITDVEITSIQVASLDDDKEFPDEADIQKEEDYYLLKRYSALDHEGENFDVNRIFELNLATELAKEQSKTMPFIENNDETDDLLFKHHMMLKRIEWNFNKFSEQLEEEISTEEQFAENLMGQQSILNAHTELEELYANANVMQEQLTQILGDSRSTISAIFDQNAVRKEMGNQRHDQQNLDVTKVKLDARLTDTIDNATADLSTVIQKTQKSLANNKKFLKEFENRYESDVTKNDSSSSSTPDSLEKLDSQIVSNIDRLTRVLFLQLSTIEDGVRLLKDKIVYEYVDETSTLTLLILVGIFTGLGFTIYKVNRMLSKMHVF